MRCQKKLIAVIHKELPKKDNHLAEKWTKNMTRAVLGRTILINLQT